MDQRYWVHRHVRVLIYNSYGHSRIIRILVMILKCDLHVTISKKAWLRLKNIKGIVLSSWSKVLNRTQWQSFAYFRLFSCRLNVLLSLIGRLFDELFNDNICLFLIRLGNSLIIIRLGDSLIRKNGTFLSGDQAISEEFYHIKGL